VLESNQPVQDWIGVVTVVYAHHMTNNIVFQYVHNIMVNIVSDLCRVPPPQNELNTIEERRKQNKKIELRH
jgi:hypothetical protein